MASVDRRELSAIFAGPELPPRLMASTESKTGGSRMTRERRGHDPLFFSTCAPSAGRVRCLTVGPGPPLRPDRGPAYPGEGGPIFAGGRIALWLPERSPRTLSRT
jgi:hypothetical protein